MAGTLYAIGRVNPNAWVILESSIQEVPYLEEGRPIWITHGSKVFTSYNTAHKYLRAIIRPAMDTFIVTPVNRAGFLEMSKVGAWFAKVDSQYHHLVHN